jgi:hypothetical protein
MRTVRKLAIVCSVFALAALCSACFDDTPSTSSTTNLHLSGTGFAASWRMGSSSTAEVRIASPEEFQSDLFQAYYAAADSTGTGYLDSLNSKTTAGISTAPPQYKAPISANAGSLNSRRFSSRIAELESEALALFSKPFRLAFAGLFKKNSDSLTERRPGEEQVRNPFSEAKAEISDAAGSESSAQAPKNSTAEAQAEKDPARAQAVGSGTPVQGRFAFIGDFDGNGQLEVVSAERVDDTTFSFNGTTRVFSLYLNPSAAEAQRSFGIDDLDGDGQFDLLATSRASLFGGILLGNGQGSFHVAGSFLTGYEPVVATVGPGTNGARDIVSLDLRVGTVTSFSSASGYRQSSVQSLGFLPDYVTHLASVEDSAEYLLAAKTGNPEVVYRWGADGRLEALDQSLPAEPSAAMNRSGSLVQVYQVGSYASIVLTNANGQSFNVANLKLWPNLSIAIGDLGGHGTLDVAAAYLLSTK